MNKPLYTYTNAETGVQAIVSRNIRFGYAVALKDLESGNVLPTILMFSNVEIAQAKAIELCGGAAAVEAV